jgi:hypothetical protein
MTDVYIAYAREDRDRLRLLADMLAYEGWAIWMNPGDSAPDDTRVTDAKLNGAGAIVAVWSERARRSEIVRSEAATGLYKNKLIQVRIDPGAPPRPFDQVEVIDLSQWRGAYDDSNWRKLILALRRAVGEPEAAKPIQPPKKKAPPVEAPPPPVSSFSSPPPDRVHRTPEPEYRPPPRVAATPPPPPRPAMTLSSPPPEVAYRAAAVEADHRPPAPQMAPAPPSPPPAPPAPRPEMTLGSPVQEPAYRSFAAAAPDYHAPPPPPPEPAYRPLPPEPSYRPLPPEPPAYRPPPPETGYRMAESTYRTPEVPPYRPPPAPPSYRAPETSYRSPMSDIRDGSESSERLPTNLSYREPRKGATWGPIAAAGLLIASGVGLWFGDPFGWRAGASDEAEPVAMAARRVPDAAIANGEPATPVFSDTEDSSKTWARVNRKNPEALRDFITAYPQTSQSEAARSALRVLDAQAWVTAVTADSESAYRSYLESFPVEGPAPGAMVAAAQERLTALGVERRQAIEEIQRGLAGIDLYDGAVDGRSGEATTSAMKAFASSARRSVPSLTAAPPRELRAFADAVRRTGSQPVVSAAVAAASEADRRRVEQAQAASLAANVAVSRTEGPTADALAKSQQQRIAEETAWEQAERAGTLAAYRAYVEAWPDGANMLAARAAMTRLDRPVAYSLEQLPAELRTAVEAARGAQSAANLKAAAARRAATEAGDLADARSIQSANGDRFDAQISNGAPNGLGVRTRGAGVNAGDRYRGELRNGQAAGVGIYEFAENAGNPGGRALRYEGEHVGDAASGLGVFHWRGGDSFSGMGAGGSGTARGALTYANGQRYEGELLNGQRNGPGVVWGADGIVIQAGRWSRDELDGPMRLP